MIVVIGCPAYRPPANERADRADGLAAAIARAAAAAGRRVELVGRAGDDPAGDALVLTLARDGVGHVALLRDPARPTPIVTPGPDAIDEPETEVRGDPYLGNVLPDEPDQWPTVDAEDLGLGLRYLTDYSVLVVAQPLPEGARAVLADAASFAGAHLIVITPAGPPPDDAPEGATVLELPPAGSGAAFALLVAGYAVALDRGEPARAAFRAAVDGSGWEPARD